MPSCWHPLATNCPAPTATPPAAAAAAVAAVAGVAAAVAWVSEDVSKRVSGVPTIPKTARFRQSALRSP